MTRWPLRRYKGYAGTNCSNEGDNYLLWKTKSQNLSHNVSEKGCQKKKATWTCMAFAKATISMARVQGKALRARFNFSRVLSLIQIWLKPMFFMASLMSVTFQ
jgi:hypothetical protein